MNTLLDNEQIDHAAESMEVLAETLCNIKKSWPAYSLVIDSAAVCALPNFLYCMAQNLEGYPILQKLIQDTEHTVIKEPTYEDADCSDYPALEK